MKTIEQIRDAFHLIHRVATGQSDRGYMSIPADPERDADLIVAAAIDELEALRAERDALRAQVEAWKEKAKVWLMSPEAAKCLDGYRELGEKCARLEAQVEAARRACEKRLKGSYATLSQATARQILDAMDEAAKGGSCDCRHGCVKCTAA